MDYKANIKSFNVNSFNNIIHTTGADDKPQVLRWLSPLEPRRRHQHLRESRLESVGRWIFQSSEFRRWDTGEDESPHSVLFCHGDPGVGKTHLSSVVIDYFYGRGQDITVTGLYCDYLDRNEQTTSNMLGAMLKQLVGRGNVPEDMRKAFEDAKDHFGGVGPRVPELVSMLKVAIAQRQRVVICIDGLDELVAAHRTGLLRFLLSISRELPNVRLFMTGRPFILSEVEKYFPAMDTISVSPRKADIEAFLRMRLDEDMEPDAMDECLRTDIMEIIPRTISEMFLLVSLSIEAILAETTIHRRKEKLKQISAGQNVGDVYDATFERIRAQKNDRSRLGMEAIMWVAHSQRLLKPDELCQALGVEIGSGDLNSENTPSIRTILNCGLGLVTVDSSSSTVRLVHFTLQEYILANPTLFHNPHSVIAEVCLTYLNSTCIRDLSPALSSPPPQTPFLEYASCDWGEHARRGTSENVISLALRLLDRFDTHISCKLILLKEFESWRPFDSEHRPIGFTGLHGAAWLGLAEIIVSLIGIKKWDVNATDLHGNTALVWAAKQGHSCVVELLLQQESVNPNMAGRNGVTPLSWAGQNRLEVVVKTLLQRSDVDPGVVDIWGYTPFSRAASSGHEGIVKMLLERNDVNPDTADNVGRTPLSFAARSGREGVVKILLERNDVNPNTVDVWGYTPLSRAAEMGHGGVVEILLKRDDASPNTADNKGRTPLSLAAGGGHAEIVKMLLERNDASPDTADKSGRSPLSWAAGNEQGPMEVLLGQNYRSFEAHPRWVTGREGRVAEILLERNDVDPDKADEDGRTPLSWAAEAGLQEIVKMLLERSDVNPSVLDKGGRTPLSWAVQSGHEGIVKLLSELNDINPETADYNGRT